MRRLSPSALLATFAFFLTFASATPAQDQLTRFEVGGQFDGIRLMNSAGNAAFQYGFGARLDVNLTRRFALESTVDYFPRNSPFTPEEGGQGGRTLQAFFGVRGKFITTRRYSVYGVLRPGLTHETNNEKAVLLTNSGMNFSLVNQTGPLTHFTLDMGGGIEVYPSDRWILRAEVDASPYFVGNIPVLISPSPGAPISPTNPISGKIYTPWKLSLGAGYRVGALREYARDNVQGFDQSQPSRFSRLTVGAQATALSLAFVDGTDQATTMVGFGPFASYRIWRFVEADGAMLLFPREEPSLGPRDGGRILQGFYGVRAGFRTQNLGFFAKVRPGFQSNSRTNSGVIFGPDSSASFTFSRATDFALDLGGVVEAYPTKHLVLRVDAGDTMLYTSARNFNVFGNSDVFPSYPRRDTIQSGVGLGWKF
jgi:Outer membrane protein beta-barrel domain